MFTQEASTWARATYEKCLEKYTWVAQKHKDGIPYTTDKNGNYDDRADKNIPWNADDGLNWWTNGFWGGILWHLYAHTKCQDFAEVARHGESLLDECFADFYGLHHDVGFMWIPTAVTDYLLTGNADSRKRALHAASLLLGRYNAAGRFIRAWNDIPNADVDTRGWAIIDCMLNIPLLHWASQETGDPRYGQIAEIHADTVMETFIRPDGSSHHIVEFDPVKGGVVRTHGGQGYANGSAWTRGQAWALYGFAVNYQWTRKAEYLHTAKRVADYFIGRMPADGIIPIDFDQPAQPALEDSCGATVAACGLLELARLCGGDEATHYRQAALRILKALDAKRCHYGHDCDAIVSHCSSAYHSPDGHHIYMVYADYFYMEALLKITQTDTGFIW